MTIYLCQHIDTRYGEFKIKAFASTSGLSNHLEEKGFKLIYITNAISRLRIGTWNNVYSNKDNCQGYQIKVTDLLD